MHLIEPSTWTSPKMTQLFYVLPCGWVVFFLCILLPSSIPAAEIDDPVTRAPQTSSQLTLEDFAPELVATSDRIQAAAARLSSSEYSLMEARSGWYPRLDLTADAGYERIDFADRQTTGEDDSSEWKNVQTLQLRQLVHDFGQTGGTIGRARAVLEQSEFNLEAVTQEVLRQGVGAYLQVHRAYQQLGYARRSEENIKRQTGIEEALVERGAGLSSDVLQAKSQLAGANARRVSLEGELINAQNRFQAVYLVDLSQEQIQRFDLPDLPSHLLPMTLEEALDIGLAENPQLEVARRNIKAVEQDITVIKSRFYPRLDFVAEGRRRQNDVGEEGVRSEARALVEFRYNLFRGGGDQAALRSALSQKTRADRELKDLRRSVEEQIRVSWRNLITARENVDYLVNQTNILHAFLELARKERRMGTRSLIDVLNGEVNYINAVSSAVAARVNTVRAAYDLLFAMGRLTPGVFQHNAS